MLYQNAKSLKEFGLGIFAAFCGSRPVSILRRSPVILRVGRERRRILYRVRPRGKAITSEDVLTLKAAAFGDDFIITKIKATPSAFTLDTPDLVKRAR